MTHQVPPLHKSHAQICREHAILYRALFAIMTYAQDRRNATLVRAGHMPLIQIARQALDQIEFPPQDFPDP